VITNYDEISNDTLVRFSELREKFENKTGTAYRGIHFHIGEKIIIAK
jgi:hypothetical protein